MKFILLCGLIASFSSFAETWHLTCSGTGFQSQTDLFEATVDTKRKLISVDTPAKGYPFQLSDPRFSSDLGAIDPGFYDIILNQDLTLLVSEVETYNYFGGNLSLAFEKPLPEITESVEFDITGDNSAAASVLLSYDDGDGRWITDRKYECEFIAYY